MDKGHLLACPLNSLEPKGRLHGFYYLRFLVTYIDVSRENTGYHQRVQDKDRKEAGKIGEQIAADFLKKRGFRIVARNFSKPWGEIDIIAEKGGILRFVEVKTLTFRYLPDVSRENNHYRPEEQAHSAKLKRVARTAEMYMNANNDQREYQIDVIGVFLDKNKRLARCRFFEQVL